MMWSFRTETGWPAPIATKAMRRDAGILAVEMVDRLKALGHKLRGARFEFVDADGPYVIEADAQEMA